jgi:hypothetical protein
VSTAPHDSVDIAQELGGILSDTELERAYARILRRTSDSHEVVLDLRHVRWLDLWCLIQILFLFDTAPIKYQIRRAIILAPSAVPPGNAAADLRSRARARLQFLVNTEFVQRLAEIGVSTWVQLRSDSSHLERIEHGAVRQLCAGDVDEDALESLPILPITPVRHLRLEQKRNELYDKARELFRRYSTESIVESAGLGDTLVTELALNARVHGGNDGYVALQVAAGLHYLRRTSASQYKARRLARLQHRLGDWRRYFSKYPDDAYFELVVADRGEGISATILSDPRRSSKGDAIADPGRRTHALIAYALETESSRFSPEERAARRMTDFTGLAAVAFVMRTHGGSLLIRDRTTRHVFGACVAPAGQFATTIAPSSRRIAQDLPEIRGASVSAVIPIGRMHHATPGIDLRNISGFDPTAVERAAAPLLASTFKRITTTPTTTIDREHGIDWASLSKTIEQQPGEAAVLLDIAKAAMEKNSFWPGFSSLVRLCRTKRRPLILLGMTPRSATRIDEFAAMDRKTLGGQLPWLLVGLGDDAGFYTVGRLTSSVESRRDLSASVAGVMLGRRRLREPIEQLMLDAGYLETVTRDDAQSLTLTVDIPSVFCLARDATATPLQAEIKATPAWLSDTVVQLASGDKVLDYLCVHSITQLRTLYPDLARLALFLSSSFSFDFVLSVGAASQNVALYIADALSHHAFRMPQGRMPHYAYQDYFGFDHGEGSRQVIPENANVLLVVDGVRSRAHCDEAISHIRDCGAIPVAVISLFDLSQHGLPSRTAEVPVLRVLRMPVRDASHDAVIRYIEAPFSFELVDADSPSDEPPLALLSKAQSYGYLEAYGLIFAGHTTFFDQHFARTISLPYLLNSFAPPKAEVVHRALDIIKEEQIDCILFPEHSSISALVDEIMRHEPRGLTTIMSRRTTAPDHGGSYGLDVLGKQQLSRARNILIVEDETYTGASIKGLLAIALSPEAVARRHVVVMTIIDSMRRTERNSLSTLLREKSLAASPDVKNVAFMRFSVCSYWVAESCPLCRLMQTLERRDFQQLGFIEERYARERIAELRPHPTDQDYRARRSLTALPRPLPFRRRNHDAITLTTYEGLELYCEEAYVEGDIAWLVHRCQPSHPEHFLASSLLSVVELLSRDFGVLGVGLRRRFLEAVRLMLFARSFHGRNLAHLLEILSQWPLHCLQYVWPDLLIAVFGERTVDFTECYPALELLLLEIDSRPRPRALSRSLIQAFDQRLVTLLEETPVADRTRRTRVDIAMCLRRGLDRRTASADLGSLISYAAYLLGYFAQTRQAHWILRGGLNALAKATPADAASDRIFTVQMGDHLRYTLEELRLRDPNADDWARHSSYDRVRELLTELHKKFPKGDVIGNAAGDLQQITVELSLLLYDDTSPGSFHGALRKYVNDRRISLKDALNSVLDIRNLAHFRITVSPAEEQLAELFVVLDADATTSVFPELANNLKNAGAHWLGSRMLSGDLFGPQFEIQITVRTEEVSTLSIDIQNVCDEAIYRKMRDGGEGLGRGQIQMALERFGHRYRIDYNQQPARLHQTLTLRRIPK